MTPRLRFQSYYFFAYSFLAFFLAFLPLHWEEIGFDRQQLALLSMASTLATLFAGPAFLHIAHRYLGARMLVVSLFLISVGCFAPQLFLHGFLVILVSWFLCSVSSKGVHSIVDARAVRIAAEGEFNFERVRIWGSIGFIVATFALGFSLDLFGISSLVIFGSIILLAMGIGTYLCLGKLDSSPAHLLVKEPVGEKTPKRQFLPSVVALLLVNAIIWGSHTPYYVYISVHLSHLGWSGAAISSAWSLGVISEIVLFRYFYLLERRFSLVSILRQAIVATAVRWLIIANFTSITWILLAQVLHLYSFGACYLASVKLIYKLLPDEYRDRGQGFLAAVGSGLGSTFGRILASMVAVSWTIPQMFVASAIASLLAFPLTFLISRENQQACE